jgi:fructokinase
VSLDVVCLGELLIDFISKDGVTFKKAAGGAPANVAVACSRPGLRSGFVGKVGDDMFGRFLKGVLEREGVDVSELYLEKGEKTTLAFVSVDAKGERSFEFRRGADGLLRPEEIRADYIRGSRLFHFSSISLTSEPARSATLKAVRVARNNGLKVTYDPNLRLNLWKSAKEARKWIGVGMEVAEVVKLNEEELEFMFGPGIERGAEKVLETADRVFVTLGERGCYYSDGTCKGYSSPYRVKVVDTTGAGDGFMGGVIYGTLKGWDVERTASFSNAAGALTIQGVGVIDSLPMLEDVLHLTGIKITAKGQQRFTQK